MRTVTVISLDSGSSWMALACAAWPGGAVTLHATFDSNHSIEEAMCAARDDLSEFARRARDAARNVCVAFVVAPRGTVVT